MDFLRDEEKWGGGRLVEEWKKGKKREAGEMDLPIGGEKKKEKRTKKSILLLKGKGGERRGVTGMDRKMKRKTVPLSKNDCKGDLTAKGGTPRAK